MSDNYKCHCDKYCGECGIRVMSCLCVPIDLFVYFQGDFPSRNEL